MVGKGLREGGYGISGRWLRDQRKVGKGLAETYSQLAADKTVCMSPAEMEFTETVH